jgi:hypothetical protein
MSTFWSIWVSAITIGTLIGCAVYFVGVLKIKQA